MSPDLLAIQGLTVQYGAIRACDDLDLVVKDSEAIGIVGPNGSGKTTLFNAIAGFAPVSSGRIVWGGKDIAGMRPDYVAHAGIARTFQQTMVFPGATVIDNVRMSLACIESKRGRKRASDRRGSPQEAIEAVGLANLADSLAISLPTGILRLLGIAIALTCEPKLLLLDEPAAGLNVGESEDLVRVLKSVASSGLALLVVDHDMSFLRPLVGHLVVLDNGRKIVEGPPDEVLSSIIAAETFLGGKFGGGKAAGSSEVARSRGSSEVTGP